MGLAELRPLDDRGYGPHIKFQSARQIWVWPNSIGASIGLRVSLVSICQADLGLAEPVSVVFIHSSLCSVSICQADLGLAEQRIAHTVLFEVAKVSICQADLGLAERFSQQSIDLEPLQFQSARQIWVWPN